MKQITKLNKRVTELSATLPLLRSTDEEWMRGDFRKNFHNKGLCYYLVMERCHEWQVIRYYYISRMRLFEFMQVWINADGEQVVRAKRRHMRVDGWVEDSDMRIWKQKPYIEYSYLGGIWRLGWTACKIRSLLPELKKRGLRTSTHCINPAKICKALLTNNRLETLFKVRQYRLVHEFMHGYYTLDDSMWQSVRVALRHGYHWDDHQEFDTWYRMIHDLRFLGLDTNNPHYICPANLMDAHQHWMDKRNERVELERIAEEMKQAEAFEPTFRKYREQFFDMMFAKGKVSIQIIPTAMGIKEEGEAMHHCVGGYYNRLNSLILSAKVDGKRMETIEVDLTDYRIVQSRGLQNKQTNYHNQIVHLMKQGLPEIRKRNEEHKLKIAV
ncbi:MAG: PcfJ domain-containing protein [Prevotella sp.]|nr:PcfJ domain-containing protein [Prevotella sp.]